MRKLLTHLIMKYSSLRESLYWIRFLRLPFGKKIYLIGTPNHSNIGDSAIACAELLFLKKIVGDNRVKELTVYEYQQNASFIKKYINKKQLICGHGGGNIGNLWYEAEVLRYNLITEFSRNPLVVFPQSVFFTDDENGKEAVKKSRVFYESRKDIVLVARDKVSFDILCDLYFVPQKHLIPDIVLSTTMKDYVVDTKKRVGVLTVFRNDKEKALEESEKERLKLYLTENNIPFHSTDMYSEVLVTINNRKSIVSEKMQEFANVKLVLTDRLHGMIFSAVSETPCIVFSNNHHKVYGSYEWISYLPYVKFAATMDEAIQMIPNLLSLDNCVYDNSPLMNYYKKLSEVIQQYVD